MAALKFAETHNLVAFLEKPEESDGFAQIATAKAKTVNGEVQLQALVDGKKVIITKTSQLALISAKTTAWNEFSSIMASVIICLATNKKFNFSKYIFESLVKNVDSSVKFLMYQRFMQVFLDKQVGEMSTHNRTYDAPCNTKKIFANMKREGKCFSRKVTPLFQTMMVQAQEEGDGSAMPTDPQYTPTISQPSTLQPPKKQPRRKQRKDTEDPQLSGPTEPVTDDTESVPTHSNDPLLSGEDRLKLNELMELYTSLSQRVLALDTTKTNQALEIDSLKRRVKKLEKKKGSRTHRLKRLFQGRNDDNLMFDTGVLDEHKFEVEKVVSTAEVTTVNAELEEEEKLARQREEDANIAEWDNIQAMMDADYELDARLQAQEQEYSKRYSSIIRMLQNIDREDLETLWKLVKTKHGLTRPDESYKRVLWGDLKVMFEPDVESEVWRNLQGHKVTVWKLFFSSGVHFVWFQNLHICMLVEKKYPLTSATITEMLNKKLQTDHWNEICYQLLKLMTKQLKNPGSV
ncbi:hypothetical protein Tco_1227749 [Tanacetum coccineum]